MIGLHQELKMPVNVSFAENNNRRRNKMNLKMFILFNCFFWFLIGCDQSASSERQLLPEGSVSEVILFQYNGFFYFKDHDCYKNNTPKFNTIEDALLAYPDRYGEFEIAGISRQNRNHTYYYVSLKKKETTTRPETILLK